MASQRFEYHALDEAATDRLGNALACALPRPAFVALCGTLGSGKTRLVRAIARGLGINPELVTSPTFVLVHEYPGETPLYHFDAYRLRDEEEFWQLGSEEYLSGAMGGITVIEWADRVETCLPKERMDVTIEVMGVTARKFLIATRGDVYEGTLKQLMDFAAGK